MRAVVQRVTSASVAVSGEVVGSIDAGLLVLLGVGQGDATADADSLADKILSLRIFEDDAGKMNRSLLDTGGECLVVSQFTLFGDCRKGRRPSFAEAAAPEVAVVLYERFVEAIRDRGVTVATGGFRAEMAVSLVNDGPVTLLLDTRKLF